MFFLHKIVVAAAFQQLKKKVSTQTKTNKIKCIKQDYNTLQYLVQCTLSFKIQYGLTPNPFRNVHGRKCYTYSKIRPPPPPSRVCLATTPLSCISLNLYKLIHPSVVYLGGGKECNRSRQHFFGDSKFKWELFFNRFVMI